MFVFELFDVSYLLLKNPSYAIQYVATDSVKVKKTLNGKGYMVLSF